MSFLAMKSSLKDNAPNTDDETISQVLRLRVPARPLRVTTLQFVPEVGPGAFVSTAGAVHKLFVRLIDDFYFFYTHKRRNAFATEHRDPSLSLEGTAAAAAAVRVVSTAAVFPHSCPLGPLSSVRCL